ncbi:MAG: hypothetical protein V1778_01425 [bacterium]
MDDNEKEGNARHCGSLHRLLQLTDLLRQVLEIKIESLYLYPLFLRDAVVVKRKQKDVVCYSKIGENLVEHIRELSALLREIGGGALNCDVPFDSHLESGATEKLLFSEKIAVQILDESQDLLSFEWNPSSRLHRALHQKLQQVRAESAEHILLLDGCAESRDVRGELPMKREQLSTSFEIV